MDYLSGMPDDCLIQIFEYLDRDSLDMMEMVSRKMCIITNLRQFNSVKRYFKDVVLGKYVDNTGRCDFAPPTKLVIGLQRFLLKNYVEVFNFVGVCIDRRFVDDCVRALRYDKGRGATVIRFRSSYFACNMRNSDKIHAFRSLLTLGMSAFVFENCEFDSIIDEAMVAAMALVPRREFRNLRVLQHSQSRISIGEMSATKNIIYSIQHFDKFIAYFITLKTEWIFELIQLVLALPKPNREWTFSVTSRRIIRSKRTIRPDSKLVTLDKNRYQLIHLATGNCAHISFEGPIGSAHKICIAILCGEKYPEPLRNLRKRST